MKRFAERMTIAAGVLALAAQAHAIPMLTHSVDGILFNETFENQTITGVQAADLPTTANMTPGVPGNNDQWYTFSNNANTGSSTILNRNAASDASLDAFEGSKYVRFNRPDGQTAYLVGDFGATDYGSGILTMSFAAYIEGTLGTGKGFVFRFDNLDGALLADTPNIAMQINATSDGNIKNVTAAGMSTATADTGLTWTPNQWQKYVIAYNLTTDTFSLSVDGNTVSNLSATHNLSDVSRFSWQALGSNSGTFYIDAIPEPSTIGALLGVALISAGRRRR